MRAYLEMLSITCIRKIKGFLYKDCKDGMETKSVPNLSAGTGDKSEVQMKCKK